MNKIKQKCFVRSQNDPICRAEVISTIRVKVYHPRSGRFTSQKWRICKKHLDLMIITKAKNWIRWYSNKYEAIVLTYSIIEIYEFSNLKITNQI